MSEQDNTFSTRDLYLASTLISLGFELENLDYQIEGERGKTVGYFSFASTPELLQTEKDYWMKKTSVEPLTYKDNMRSLKARINGASGNPHSGM